MNTQLLRAALIASIVIGLLGASGSWAQRAGESVSVQYGVVRGGREVDLQSSAVPTGALVGGTLGLLSAGGKSTGKKVRNSLLGGIAGGAIASGSRGDTRGMVYEVDMGSGGATQVVTNQREIRTGDCVAVEKAGDTANLRRVSSAYCDKANSKAVSSVASEAREEAEECLTAKQQLVNAATTDELDLAQRKVGLLCDD